MIQLRAKVGPTGRLLQRMLEEKQLLAKGAARPLGVVNYGYAPSSDLPTLNKYAGTLNKFEELCKLREKGVAVIPFARVPGEVTCPFFGRLPHHTRGKDIRVFRTHQPLLPRPNEFYSQLVPKRKEFRVFAYRGRSIGVYEKVLHYPNKLGRRGRSRDVWNWANGYGFEYRKADAAPIEIKELACRAVAAINLDFGAVDIIESLQGQFLVLEVNTAPGVEGPRQALVSLVNHISKWVAGGYKRRNGEERVQ